MVRVQCTRAPVMRVPLSSCQRGALCRAEIQSQPDSAGATSVAEADGQPAQPDAATCAYCGIDKANMPFGCDGDGHKSAGIGSFVDWWPLKVWSPCPRAKEKGLPYVRKGQNIDEVLFGRSDKTPK